MTTSVLSFADQRARSAEHLLAQVPEHVGRVGWSPGQVLAHQRRELASLLAQAAEHSPFHARRLAGIVLASIDPGDPEGLRRLPVMTKADLMAHYDDVVTDRRLTRAGLEAHIASLGDVPVLHLDEYLCLASGGSSGVRGLYAWHWTACSHFLLGMIRRALAGLLAAGGPPPGGVPMAMVAGARPVHATAAFPVLFGGRMIDVRSVPATLPLPEIVERLHEIRPLMLQGYPAVLSALAREQEAGRLRITPRSVTSTSEPLDEPVASRVARAFGVPVTNQFGSSEGLLGTSAPGSPWIELADDLTVVELVDAQDRPVPPGVPSASVLVTSLTNRAQPLIRYRMEDSLVALPAGAAEAASGHLFVRADGRSDQVFRYGSAEVHPAALRAVLGTTSDVLDYQVRQTRDGLDVAVVPLGGDAGPDDAELGRRLGAVLASAGLADGAVRVRTVATTPADELSGKARRFVPL